MVETVLVILAFLIVFAFCSLAMFQNEADYHLSQQKIQTKKNKNNEPPIVQGTPWPLPSWEEEEFFRQMELERKAKEKQIQEIRIRWIDP